MANFVIFMIFLVVSILLAFAGWQQGAEVQRHVPLLEVDGRKIEGLKRCAECGLSETYWKKFPSCD